MAGKTYSVNEKLHAAAEEAYIALRSNLQFSGFDKRLKTITVTSIHPEEGKTTTVINLGIAMAKTGMRILMLDADLRKPMLAKRLESTAALGLSNVISGYAALEEAISKTNVENLYFLGSGPKPPNPNEMITSDKFSSVLSAVGEMYDMVIIDTPPLGSVIDSAVIASRTDGAILVIKNKSTDYRAALRVKQQLEKANAKILGVVLNKVRNFEYRYYYGHHRYYGSKDDKVRSTNRGIFGSSRKNEKVLP